MLFCRLSAAAGDRDGASDIDSAWAVIPGIGFWRRLVFDPDSGRYYYTLWGSAIPGQRLETLVGMRVGFRVADEYAVAGCDTGPGVTRILYDLPQLVFPAGGLDTVRADTTLVWQRFDYGYWVRYHGEVVRIEGGSPAGVVAVFDLAGLADTSYRLAAALLQAGDYYWTVEAIDALGNSSRSAEELFHAQ